MIHLARSLRVVGMMLLVITTAPTRASAKSPDKFFPTFASHKDSLGVIAMVGDVVVVEDVIGNVEKVYVDDCRQVGEALLDRFSKAMTEKGYHIERRPLLSIGQTLSNEKKYRHLSNWKQQHSKDDDAFPAGLAPLYVDSTQSSDESHRNAWGGLFRRTVALKLGDAPLKPFPEAMTLRDSIAHDYVLVVTLVSNRIPQGKSFMHSMLNPLPNTFTSLSAVDPCDANYNDGVIMNPISSSLCRIAIIDCRSGEAAWADSECQGHTFSENQISAMTQGILKRLP